jgi:ribosome maturation factor RimP
MSVERQAQLQERIETMLREGFPEVEVLLAEQVSPGMLRVTIDRPGGVDLELCEQVSRALSTLRERYSLEVSSPGIERPLVKPEHFRRVVGEEVAVRTEEPIEGRRRFKGTLTDARDETIEIDQDGMPVRIPLAAIRRGTLVVEQVGGTR